VKRTYRTLVGRRNLSTYEVCVKETDLLIRSGRFLKQEAETMVLEARTGIEAYIDSHANFLESRVPLPEDSFAPRIVREMIRAASFAGVGPMAAVAGAVAEWVGRGLLELGESDVLVENGGDIFIASGEPVIVGVFAGASPLSLKLGINIPPDKTPLGICTSSGAFGHSFSYGRSDAALTLASSTALADAAATALGNRVSRHGDIPGALEWVRNVDGISGALVILGDRMGVFGEFELVRLSGSPLDR